MEAQAASSTRAAAPPPEPQQRPLAAPFLPAPQFTFQPFQRDPPLYFDSRTASFRPDAAPGAGPGGSSGTPLCIASRLQQLVHKLWDNAQKLLHTQAARKASSP